jgi:uncharacterized protein YaiI (UPF0178 family)
VLTIYVDGDSCPVKEEVIRVAQRHGLEVYMVSNGGLRPSNNPRIHVIVVESGPDVADNWIAERAGDGDITITADILLADRCIKNNVSVINPNGQPFTEDNIGSAIAGRELNAYLREIGAISGHNASFTRQNRSLFLQSLEQAIQDIKRR